MIYEMRTYDLKPRTVAEFERRCGEAYVRRRQHWGDDGYLRLHEKGLIECLTTTPGTSLRR
ncbi:MAG: hypothetical protein WKH97_12995 [Casimicrobiaceae bacterium]